jgi:hypothetical protein
MVATSVLHRDPKIRQQFRRLAGLGGGSIDLGEHGSQDAGCYAEVDL